MRRFICALAVAVGSHTTLAVASEPKIIVAATQCPSTGADRACLHASIIPDSRRGEEVDGGYVFPEYPDPHILHIKGRLNGGAPQRYRLQVTHRKGDYHSSMPPELAYLGQSRRGRAVILTSEGVLEILTEGYAPHGRGRLFFDERTWKPLDMDFLYTSSGITVVSSPTEIGVWDEKRQLCVSGLLPERERLRILDGGCRAHPDAPPRRGTAAYAAFMRERAVKLPGEILRWGVAWYRGQVTGLTTEQIIEINTPVTSESALHYPIGNIEPAPLPLSKVRRLFPDEVNEEMGPDDAIADHFGGMGTGIDIERIQGTHILMITITHDGC